jgi:branched-subunit amino acid aminotransferase/4-amino-4-deoxychorismate lyase
VLDGTLRTPPLNSGCLAGITRELVLEWCREDGLDIVEEAMPLDVLEHADEVFLTSSIKDVFRCRRSTVVSSGRRGRSPQRHVRCGPGTPPGGSIRDAGGAPARPA